MTPQTKPLDQLHSGTSWRKSTRSSSNGGQCVEVRAFDGAQVAVRDSKLIARADFPILTTDAGDWIALISDIRNDRLTR